MLTITYNKTKYSFLVYHFVWGHLGLLKDVAQWNYMKRFDWNNWNQQILVQNNLICFLFFVFICCDVFFYHWCGVWRHVLFWQGGWLVCQRLSAVVNADFGGVQVLLEGEASTLTPNCLGSTIPVLNQAARVTGYYCALMCNTIILLCIKCASPPIPLPE